MFRRGWRIPAGWLAVLLLYSALAQASDPLIGAWITYVACAAAAIVACYGCLQAAGVTEGRPRRGWLLFASACVASIVGQLTWALGSTIPAGRFLLPYGPDALFILFGALTAAAIFDFRTQDAAYSSRWRQTANVALISLAFVAACIASLPPPPVRPADPPYAMSTALLQLSVFAFAFVVALYMLWSYRWNALRGTLLLIVSAVVVQATCGVIYVHATFMEMTAPPIYVSAAWIAAFGLLHWASREQLRSARAAAAAPPPADYKHERLVEALLPGVLLLTMLLAVWTFREHMNARALIAIGAAVALFAIVLAAREALVYFEESRLERELAHTRQSLRTKTSALHEKEEWLRIAARAGNVGLWAVELPSYRSYYSPEWKRQLGYEEHEIGDSFEEWRSRVHADDIDNVMDKVRAFIEHPSESYQAEVRMRRKDGRYCWILTQAAILRAEDGTATSMVGSHVDITRQKEAEQSAHEGQERYRERAGELEQRVSRRTQELQEAYKELESFSYAVAHDLKSPLRAMNGFSALLLERTQEKLDPVERGYLERIRAGAERMNALIEGLLDYARIDRREMHGERFAFGGLVRALIAERPAAESEHIELKFEGVEPTMNLDREALSLILRNLLDNAVKFTRKVEQPRIEIGVRTSGSRALVWVKDNGIGFDPQYQDQIFAMFKRLHRDDQYPGTGVGLALAAKAAQRMRGRLWAESAPGEGATFYLELTAESPQAAQRTESAAR